MKRPHYTSRDKGWILGLLLVGAAVSVPVGVWTVIGYQAEVALRESDARVCALVDAQRVVGRQQEHEVRYHFEVGGERYTYADATGRSDLWASVSAADLERAESEGCVDVVYLPRDPSVNRPLAWARLNSPLGNKAGGAVLVMLVLLLCGGGILGIRRVARTPLWRVTRLNDTHVVLELDGEERSVLRSTLRRSVLLERPRSMQHPPWRFPCDVLMLRTSEETWAVGARGPHWAELVESLQREARIKRKQSG